ncbi:hypothetical protein [Pleomorphomonas carboxyditropha]|uniref:hypothetical protein n=1 Tax=Pleomorphomonas carboxyditropha TaxID=2023338 RepID=UPI00105502B4|nr:hypothetical protein [Pleomorphomonas carboxyditropha]
MDTTDTADTTVVSANSIPASSKTGGDGNPAVSPDAPSETATGNPDGGSNGVETALAATVDGVGQTDAKTTVAPEPATVAPPDSDGAPASTASTGQTDTETTETPVAGALTPVEVKLEEERFTLVLPTVHGGKLKGIGETVWLTREKHAAFVGAGRVAAPWPDTTN